MLDPVQRHPTRGEQLDIMVGLVADGAEDGAAVLDLGCGKGYVLHLLLARRSGLRLVGLDRSAEALAEARQNLGPGVALLAGDLERFAGQELPEASFRFVLSALTFHDLTDAAKQAVIARAATLLQPGGAFLLYDRLRLTAPSLFPLQRSIWDRVERLHGRGMRTAESYEAYLADLGSDNRPASQEEYFGWFRAAGLEPACLHLHGNVALLAGGRPA